MVADDLSCIPQRTHGLNLGVHLLNGWLVAALAVALGGSALAGAVFLVHPLTIQATAYGVEGHELWSTSWFLLSVWMLVTPWRFGRVMRLTLTVACAALAIRTMDSALCLVALLPFVYVWRYGLPEWRPKALHAAVVAFGAIGLGLYVWTMLRANREAFAAFPWYRWFAVQTVAAWWLAGVGTVNWTLSIDHAWWTAGEWTQALAVASIGLTGLWAWRERERHPWGLFLWGWWMCSFGSRFASN
jgi:hypothetical protein